MARLIWCVICLLSAVFVMIFLASARSRDLDGAYSNSPDHSWFEKQRNSAGISCCEIADGHRIEDSDWGWRDGHYWVRIDGKQVDVPSEAVINPKDRPVDYAVVWIYQGRIECFMAGAGS